MAAAGDPHVTLGGTIRHHGALSPSSASLDPRFLPGTWDGCGPASGAWLGDVASPGGGEGAWGVEVSCLPSPSVVTGDAEVGVPPALGSGLGLELGSSLKGSRGGQVCLWGSPCYVWGGGGGARWRLASGLEGTED